jgi:hypothetical protein
MSEAPQIKRWFAADFQVCVPTLGQRGSQAKYTSLALRIQLANDPCVRAR